VEIFSANKNHLFIKNLNFFSVVKDNSVIQLNFFLSKIYNLRSIMSVLLRLSYRICPRGLINIRKFYSHAFPNSILSIKNGNDNVRIEDNCLEEELATTPILSEIRTLSLTFVMLMRFFARLNIYYKTFLTRMQCDTTPFTSCCHNVDFCIAFLRQSANNYRHCSFCAQISPVVLKKKQ
jgi:hypothetical protein